MLFRSLVKGLKHPDWPSDPWDGLKRLALMLLQHTSAGTNPASGRGRVVVHRLALGA